MEEFEHSRGHGHVEYIRPSLLVQMLAGILVLASVAIFLFFVFRYADHPTPEELKTLAILGGISLVMAGMAATTLLTRIEVERDAITIKGVLSSKRVRRADIAGSRSRYAGRYRGRELWLVDKSGERFVIPNVLKNRFEANSWVHELGDLDDADARHTVAGYAADVRLGKTEDERKERGLHWQSRCNALNLVAGIVCWAALVLPGGVDASYYWTLLPAVAAMPLIALGVVWFTYGAVDLFNNALLNGPSVLILSISPVLLAWRAMDWPLVDGWIVWLGAFGLAIPITMGLSRVTRAAGHSLAIRGPVIFGLATAYIGSVFILADVRQDRREPQKVEAEISSIGHAITTPRRHHRDTRVRMKPWDLKPYGVTFSIRGYAAAPGDRYCSVLVHPGSLGIRWLELGSCYAASKSGGDAADTRLSQTK